MSAKPILLAEDVAANVLLFQAVLEGAGYAVEVAENGPKAAELGASGRFGLILMDIGLPGLSGVEAAERIRAAEIETPILALTAEDDRGSERACIDAGMNGYLAKPVSPEALLTAVAQSIA